MKMLVEISQKQHESSSSVVIHYCKVCNRRFNCAGALGGHMRSHTVAGDHVNTSCAGEREDDYIVKRYKSSRSPEGQKHPYFLRTNSSRFVRHNPNQTYQKDHDRDSKSAVTFATTSSPRDDEEYYRASREEEDLANCLVMLSSNASFFSSTSEDDNDNGQQLEGNNKEDKEVEIMTNNITNKGMLQCKACKKVFNSHQALGGHRATHNKVKGCYAAKLANNLNNNNNSNHNSDEFLDSDYTLPSPPPPPPTTAISRKRSRVHECSICHRIFSSGQALGGHKRSHWLSSGMTDATTTTLIQNFQGIAAYDHIKSSPPLIFKNPTFAAAPRHHPSLDLNFPPLLSQPAEGINGNKMLERDTQKISYLQLWGNEKLVSSANTGINLGINYLLGSTAEVRSGIITNASNTNQNHQNPRNIIKNSDDEKKCDEVKAEKLSEMKDMKIEGDDSSASGWLQVGIASIRNIVSRI